MAETLLWSLPGPHRLVPLDDISQIGRIRRDAMALAREAGLRAEDVERVGIVATETATNIVKFGGSDGAVLLRSVQEPAAVELTGLDRGPGIADPDRLFADQASTVGTLGTGLGAIRRLSDDFDLYTAPGAGTVLFARIQARRPTPSAPPPLPAVAAVCVAARDLPDCGDGWAVQRRGERTGLLVLDALGHGPVAAAVVRRSAEVLREGTPSGPEATLQCLHLGVAGSRCAVAMAVEIGGGEVVSAGVGNISGRVFADDASHRLVSHPGILGQGTPVMRLAAAPFPAGSLLVLHSDGLSQKWRMEDHPGLRFRHPAVIAGVLFRDYVNRQDDATVLVARAVP